jgi:acyl-CoA hydrolase
MLAGHEEATRLAANKIYSTMGGSGHFVLSAALAHLSSIAFNPVNEKLYRIVGALIAKRPEIHQPGASMVLDES